MNASILPIRAGSPTSPFALPVSKNLRRPLWRMLAISACQVWFDVTLLSVCVEGAPRSRSPIASHCAGSRTDAGSVIPLDELVNVSTKIGKTMSFSLFGPASLFLISSLYLQSIAASSSNHIPDSEECAIIIAAERDGLGWSSKDFTGTLSSVDGYRPLCGWKAAGLRNPYQQKNRNVFPILEFNRPIIMTDGSARLDVGWSSGPETFRLDTLVCILSKIKERWTLQGRCRTISDYISPPPFDQSR